MRESGRIQGNFDRFDFGKQLFTVIMPILNLFGTEFSTIWAKKSLSLSRTFFRFCFRTLHVRETLF